MKTGIILISHGSKLNSGNDGLFKVADMLRAMNRWDVVEAAFLQLAEPGFPEVVKQTVGSGVDRIVVVPLLLFKEIMSLKIFLKCWKTKNRNIRKSSSFTPII